jgi:hypothetical protein
MNAPVIARILGLLFLVSGIAGFVPWVAPAAPFAAPVLVLDTGYALLFGLFPVNIAHDALHMLFGLWGLLGAMSFGGALIYLRSVVWIYLVLVIVGICPLLFTLFGAVPVYGWDVGLHLIVVLFAAYGGYGRGSLRPDAETAKA